LRSQDAEIFPPVDKTVDKAGTVTKLGSAAYGIIETGLPGLAFFATMPMSQLTMCGRDIFCIWPVCSPIGLMSGSNRAQVLYEVRPRKDHRGVDLMPDALPFGRLRYGEANATSNAIGYAKFYCRSQT
jgi:hypothetical protein